MIPASPETNRLHALIGSLRDFVLRARRSLDDEIRSYPTPIPRCDAQFNHAYEQRARLAALLQRMAAADDDVGANALLRAMAEFSALPSLGESDEERSLRARVADALAGAGIEIVASPERSTRSI